MTKKKESTLKVEDRKIIIPETELKLVDYILELQEEIESLEEANDCKIDTIQDLQDEIECRKSDSKSRSILIDGLFNELEEQDKTVVRLEVTVVVLFISLVASLAYPFIF